VPHLVADWGIIESLKVAFLQGYRPDVGATKAFQAIVMRAAFLVVAIAAVALGALALYQHRFEYHERAGFLLRVNRITGEICAVPVSKGSDVEVQYLLVVPACQ
jgi:predicted aconitase with swiveling domain